MRKIITIILITIFLFKLILFFIMTNTTNQIKTALMIKAKGRRPVKNILNIATEGVKAFISVSVINQSNDKKASEEEPILSTG